MTVYERSASLDPAPRTLIATSRIQSILGSDCEPAVVNRIDRFDLYANGKMGSVAMDPADVVVERALLIRQLYERAVNAGVDIIFGRRLRTCVQETGHLRLGFRRSDGSTEEVAASVLIGADGLNSAVARLCGWDPQPWVPLAQAVVKLPAGSDPGTSTVWFRPQDTPYFYWLIPNGSGEGALGLIGTGAKNPRGSLDAFLSDKGYEAESYQAARIPCYGRWKSPHKRLQGADVYLVGDAAGHVKVSTVGGLVTGFRGAEAVVRAVLTGSGIRMGAFRLEMDLHLLIRKVLHDFKEDDYARLLQITSGRSSNSMGRISRDQALAVLLRVGRAQPRLFLGAARAILSRKSFPFAEDVA